MNASHILYDNFPIQALPPLVRDAAVNLYENIGAPMGMICSSLMASMFSVSQGLYNVERIDGLESPVSAWFLIIADSGERKTAVDEKVNLALRQFEAEQAEKHALAMEIYLAKLAAWQAKKAAILSMIKRATADDLPTDQLTEQLVSHSQRCPNRPRLFRALYSDASQAGLKKALDENWPSIAIASDEAAGVFNGDIFLDLAFHNRLWGGSTIHSDRANRKSIIVRDPRLTMSLMIQPGPLKRYWDSHGQKMREIGFAGRFLFACPPSTQGYRIIVSPESSWSPLSEFHKKVRQILERNIGVDGEAPSKTLLTLSRDAQDRWIDACNSIEMQMQKGRPYANAKDYAAKIADNLARIAAVFHVFEGVEGPIQLWTINRAIMVAEWFTSEFLRLFVPPPEIPQEVLDAQVLERWLAQKIRSTGQWQRIRKNVLLQDGKRPLRKAPRCNLALDVLISQEKIWLAREGKTTWVFFNPAYFTLQTVNILANQAALQS